MTHGIALLSLCHGTYLCLLFSAGLRLCCVSCPKSPENAAPLPGMSGQGHLTKQTISDTAEGNNLYRIIHSGDRRISTRRDPPHLPDAATRLSRTSLSWVTMDVIIIVGVTHPTVSGGGGSAAAPAPCRSVSEPTLHTARTGVSIQHGHENSDFSTAHFSLCWRLTQIPWSCRRCCVQAHRMVSSSSLNVDFTFRKIDYVNTPVSQMMVTGGPQINLPAMWSKASQQAERRAGSAIAV